MKLRFFGRLRDSIGDDREVVLPPHVRDSAQLRAWGGLTYVELLDPTVKIALDDRIVVGIVPLGDAREVSFLPAVSGG